MHKSSHYDLFIFRKAPHHRAFLRVSHDDADIRPDSIALRALRKGGFHRGRLIPTTSCDEYFAELALWLGVSPSELSTVIPNIERFYSPGSGAPIGFLGGGAPSARLFADGFESGDVSAWSASQ